MKHRRFRHRVDRFSRSIFSFLVFSRWKTRRKIFSCFPIRAFLRFVLLVLDFDWNFCWEIGIFWSFIIAIVWRLTRSVKENDRSVERWFHEENVHFTSYRSCSRSDLHGDWSCWSVRRWFRRQTRTCWSLIDWILIQFCLKRSLIQRFDRTIIVISVSGVRPWEIADCSTWRWRKCLFRIFFFRLKNFNVLFRHSAKTTLPDWFQRIPIPKPKDCVELCWRFHFWAEEFRSNMFVVVRRWPVGLSFVHCLLGKFWLEIEQARNVHRF